MKQNVCVYGVVGIETISFLPCPNVLPKIYIYRQPVTPP